MTELLTLIEKRRLALFINRAEGIWEGFGSVTPGDVTEVVGTDRAELVATTINGMLMLVGYHETMNALNAATRNKEIIGEIERMYFFIDNGDLDAADGVLDALRDILPADPELIEAGALIDRLRITK